MRKTAIILTFAAVTLFILNAPARAGALSLTTDGISRGFVLTTFVDGYVFGNYGPIAQGIAPTGKVITGSAGDGNVYVFNDVDNQHLSDAISATPYTCQTSNCNYAMATAGGEVYGAQAFGGVYEHFDSTGGHTPIAGLNLNSLLGMWGNPVNGHLIAASYAGLVDIDPVAGTYRVINAGLFPDGVSVSSDGMTAYVENGGAVQSYNIATGALIHTFITGHSPDGTGVIIGGPYDGDVVVNNNDGTVGLLDPSKADGDPLQYVIIASGGSRGDFASPDRNDGTLFLSELYEVDRLSCGPGCSIGVSSTPEPATQAMFATGLLLVGLLRLPRKRR